MPVHYPDILDEQESLRAPLMQSAIFHVAVCGLVRDFDDELRRNVARHGADRTHVGDAVSSQLL